MVAFQVLLNNRFCSKMLTNKAVKVLIVVQAVVISGIFVAFHDESSGGREEVRSEMIRLNISGENLPNIVFLYADDLGFNDVPWNNKDIVAPNLEELSKKSIIFSNYYTYPTCNPSRAALMTSYYKSQSEMPPLNTLSATGLSIQHKIFPQYFNSLGYTSHAVGKRGFDTFYGYYNGAETYYTHETQVYRHKTLYDFFDQESMDLGANGTYSATLFTARSQHIIKTHAQSKKPFFLYLAYQNIHMPVEEPPGDRDHYPSWRSSVRKTAMKMVTAMDQSIGEVMSTLREQGLSENTIVVFASDNGAMTCGGGNNFPLRGGKHTQWEGGIRVPALINLPEKIGKVQGQYDGLFHVVDWLPTLYSLVGGDLNALPSLDGVDQSSVVKGNFRDRPRTEIHHVYRYGIGYLRMGDYKILVGDHIGGDLITPADQENNLTKACAFNPEKKGNVKSSNSKIEMYNLKDDPGETTPLRPSAETDALLLRYRDIKCSICQGFQSLLFGYLSSEGQSKVLPEMEEMQPPKKSFHVLEQGRIETGWC